MQKTEDVLKAIEGEPSVEAVEQNGVLVLLHRPDLVTTWPEHANEHLQHVINLMRKAGAPFGIQADILSVMGRITEQRRPGKLAADEMAARGTSPRSTSFPDVADGVVTESDHPR